MQSAPVYIAAQHMILAAVSHGLRGCLVDFIDIEKINGILGLPENAACQLLVPVGYPAEIPKHRKPRSRTEIFFYDRWGKSV
jgi:nitroreductase